MKLQEYFVRKENKNYFKLGLYANFMQLNNYFDNRLAGRLIT